MWFGRWPTDASTSALSVRMPCQLKSNVGSWERSVMHYSGQRRSCEAARPQSRRFRTPRSLDRSGIAPGIATKLAALLVTGDAGSNITKLPAPPQQIHFHRVSNAHSCASFDLSNSRSLLDRSTVIGTPPPHYKFAQSLVGCHLRTPYRDRSRIQGL